MLKAISAILPCSCLPCPKQADKKGRAIPLKFISKQYPPHPSSTTKQQQRQKQEQQPAQETVSLSPPAEDALDTTLTAIEASIEPSHEHDEDQDDEEQTKPDTSSKRASAPPNLELNLPYEPLPDFSLNPRSRLSYWGPPPFLAPNHPLPDIPIGLPQSRERINEASFYSAYFHRGEETATRTLLLMQ